MHLWTEDSLLWKDRLTATDNLWLSSTKTIEAYGVAEGSLFVGCAVLPEAFVAKSVVTISS